MLQPRPWCHRDESIVQFGGLSRRVYAAVTHIPAGGKASTVKSLSAQPPHEIASGKAPRLMSTGEPRACESTDRVRRHEASAISSECLSIHVAWTDAFFVMRRV
jgi:hypothetical protein